MLKILRKKLQRYFGTTQRQTILTYIAKSNDPYLKGRLEWNYLFNDILRAKHHWRLTALLALASNLFIIIGMIYLSLQSRFIPYAVKVDQLGNALYAGFLNQEKTISALEINAFLRQFVMNSRSVILDAFAQKHAIDFAYNVSLPVVRKSLDHFYREQNPFELAKQESVDVQIQHVIQKSAHTWQVDWLEIHHSLDGQVMKQANFEALITLTHLPVKNLALLNINPLNLFIQQLHWAQQSD